MNRLKRVKKSLILQKNFTPISIHKVKKYRRKPSSQFKKDYKKIKHNAKICDVLECVLSLLETDHILPIQYKDHQLKGKLSHLRECHLLQDMLLIYSKEEGDLLLYLIRMGSHSELFE